MAETLGTLCDKLTVVKLKQWHTRSKIHLSSLGKQEKQLQKDLEEFLQATIAGKIPLSRLTFDSNKVYRKKDNVVDNVFGNIGEVFSELCHVNCSLWHEQEKVYAFEKVPAKQKNTVVKKLAILNLKRNKCIDRIDSQFRKAIKKMKRK
ncbi:MAG: hypothetical protein KAS66_04945 [Candidatus Omnitrophica bacterium]|nr:hypothetical protein [Candidatus Omnitrophota bacterium]